MNYYISYHIKFIILFILIVFKVYAFEMFFCFLFSSSLLSHFLNLNRKFSLYYECIFVLIYIYCMSKKSCPFICSESFDGQSFFLIMIELSFSSFFLRFFFPIPFLLKLFFFNFYCILFHFLPLAVRDLFPAEASLNRTAPL